MVFTPSFIPGLTASVDYYHVKIGNAISTIGGNSQAAYNICLESGLTSPYCNLISRPLGYTNTSPANFPTQIISLSQNVAMNARGGFDTEISYVSDLSSWSDVNGFVNFRLFWNHQEVSSVISTPGGMYTNNVNNFQQSQRQGHHQPRIQLRRVQRDHHRAIYRGAELVRFHESSDDKICRGSADSGLLPDWACHELRPQR